MAGHLLHEVPLTWCPALHPHCVADVRPVAPLVLRPPQEEHDVAVVDQLER